MDFIEVCLTPALSWKAKCFYRQRGLPFTTGLSECKYWPTLHHDPLQMFGCKSRALTKIWQLPIRHYSCLMNSWSDVASLIRGSDRGDWLELREKMSIPMKEFIINLSFSNRELVNFHLAVLLFQFYPYFPVSKNLNSILMIVIPASSPVDSPLLLLDGLSDLEFSTSWSN